MHNHTLSIKQDRDPWDEDQREDFQVLKITTPDMKISSKMFYTVKGMIINHITED